MKIGGKPVTKCIEILVLPRVDGDLIIKAEAVAINDEFNALCPEPQAPSVRTKDGKKDDLEDPDYLKAVDKRSVARWDYMCIKSLAPSEIEWDKVNLSQPITWNGWKQELLDAGLSEIEVGRIQGAVQAANSLDEDKLKEARDSFVRGQDQ
jgi:hypothetical protein